MSDTAFEFRGATPGPDGATIDHLAIVREPRQETGAAARWFCTVECSTLMARPENIGGATAAQALRLAKLFVLDLLDQHHVTIEALDREH